VTDPGTRRVPRTTTSVGSPVTATEASPGEGGGSPAPPAGA
jgi:hypothetical protein